MFFIIDNGENYEDHEIHFVEAPASFRQYFEEVILPVKPSRNLLFTANCMNCVKGTFLTPAEYRKESGYWDETNGQSPKARYPVSFEEWKKSLKKPTHS